MLPPTWSSNRKRKFGSPIQYPWKKMMSDDHSIDLANIPSSLDDSIDMGSDIETTSYSDFHEIAILKIQKAFLQWHSRRVLKRLEKEKLNSKSRSIQNYIKFMDNMTIPIRVEPKRHIVTSSSFVLSEKLKDLVQVQQEIKSLKKFKHIHCFEEESFVPECEVDLLEMSLNAVDLNQVKPNLPIQFVKKRRGETIALEKKRKLTPNLSILDKPPKYSK
jgi:hypothetical protein